MPWPSRGPVVSLPLRNGAQGVSPRAGAAASNRRLLLGNACVGCTRREERTRHGCVASCDGPGSVPSFSVLFRSWSHMDSISALMVWLHSSNQLLSFLKLLHCPLLSLGFSFGFLVSNTFTVVSQSMLLEFASWWFPLVLEDSCVIFFL